MSDFSFDLLKFAFLQKQNSTDFTNDKEPLDKALASDLEQNIKNNAFSDCLEREVDNYQEKINVNKALNNSPTKEIATSLLKENLSLYDDLALIDRLDNEPVVIGNEIDMCYCKVSNLINTMIDSLTKSSRITLQNNLALLKIVSAYLNSDSNLKTELNLCMCESVSLSRCEQISNYVYPLWILMFNLFTKLTKDPKENLPYEKQKETKDKKPQSKQKDKAQRMLEFSAQFDFKLKS